MEKNSMEQTNTENRLLQLLLETGERLMASGAEVKRVEDTLERIGVAYGAERMNVFVITSSIVITLERSDGTLLTHTRRITKSGTDFLALERINALSRECCKEPLPLDLFEQRLRECVPPKNSGRCIWEVFLLREALLCFWRKLCRRAGSSRFCSHHLSFSGKRRTASGE